MNCKWLEYLQSSFAGHQTVYTAAYPQSGSDHLFAIGMYRIVNFTIRPEPDSTG